MDSHDVMVSCLSCQPFIAFSLSLTECKVIIYRVVAAGSVLLQAMLLLQYNFSMSHGERGRGRVREGEQVKCKVEVCHLLSFHACIMGSVFSKQ